VADPLLSHGLENHRSTLAKEIIDSFAPHAHLALAGSARLSVSLLATQFGSTIAQRAPLPAMPRIALQAGAPSTARLPCPQCYAKRCRRGRNYAAMRITSALQSLWPVLPPMAAMRKAYTWPSVRPSIFSFVVVDILKGDHSRTMVSAGEHWIT
jgi:hypothetical protein